MADEVYKSPSTTLARPRRLSAVSALNMSGCGKRVGAASKQAAIDMNSRRSCQSTNIEMRHDIPVVSKRVIPEATLNPRSCHLPTLSMKFVFMGFTQ